MSVPPATDCRKGRLVLEDGSCFTGHSFGWQSGATGEVVFNTGMVGYPEAITDPSYKGQVLALTYPLVGNYGVSGRDGSLGAFESGKIQIAGLIVSHVSECYSHYDALQGLPEWLCDQRIPALSGVDVRALTKRLRERGTMLGKIAFGDDDIGPRTETGQHLVSLVSISKPIVHPGGDKRVAVIDCGCKNSIIQSLRSRGLTVVQLPWNYDVSHEQYDGLVVSNGPGDPKACQETIAHVRHALGHNRPIFGICLGHQVLALAAGADTYKLKFGHRSHNQPCAEARTRRCYITSQNHGYAVDERTLPADWMPWFTNVNDGTNEGIRHRRLPFMSVQFHPEAAPGPTDTEFLFDAFVEMVHGR